MNRRGCDGLYSNAFVNDCVEFFYSRRVLGLQRDNLKPVRRETFRSRNDYDPSSTTVPKNSVPTSGGEAAARGTSSTRSCHPRNVSRRSGMQCGDPGARMSQSAVGLVDRQRTEDVEPQSRRARFRARNTEPDDQLDMDQVLTFLDQMNFKPSKNKAAGNCPAAANVDSAGSPPDVSKSSPPTREAHAASSEALVCDDLAVTSVQLTDVASYSTVGNAGLVTTPPRPAYIPDTVVAWKSLSSEKCAGPDTSSEPLPSGLLEPAEYESSHRMHSCQIVAMTERGQGDSVSPLFENSADSLLSSTVALSPSECYVAGNDTRPDEVTCGDGEDTNIKLEGVVFSPQRPPVCHVSPPRCSPGGVHTPRLLSADASYYLEQEDGDVIIESSSEEDFDN